MREYSDELEDRATRGGEARDYRELEMQRGERKALQTARSLDWILTVIAIVVFSAVCFFGLPLMVHDVWQEIKQAWNPTVHAQGVVILDCDHMLDGCRKNPQLVSGSAELGGSVLPMVYHCDPGYELYGVNFEWKNGMLSISPQACVKMHGKP